MQGPGERIGMVDAGCGDLVQEGTRQKLTAKQKKKKKKKTKKKNPPSPTLSLEYDLPSVSISSLRMRQRHSFHSMGYLFGG